MPTPAGTLPLGVLPVYSPPDFYPRHGFERVGTLPDYRRARPSA